MPGFLQRLRAKPPKTRKQIALGTSVTVTSLVFVMWVTVLNYGFIGSEAEMQNINADTTQVASPLSAFSENASTAFQRLKEGFASSTDFDSSALGTSSQASSTSQHDLMPATNRNNSYQSDDDSDSYWKDHQRMQTESGDTEGSSDETEYQSAAVSNSSNNNNEPFTSRNYDPSQASDWFNE